MQPPDQRSGRFPQFPQPRPRPFLRTRAFVPSTSSSAARSPASAPGGVIASRCTANTNPTEREASGARPTAAALGPTSCPRTQPPHSVDESSGEQTSVCPVYAARRRMTDSAASRPPAIAGPASCRFWNPTRLADEQRRGPRPMLREHDPVSLGASPRDLSMIRSPPRSAAPCRLRRRARTAGTASPRMASPAGNAAPGRRRRQARATVTCPSTPILTSRHSSATRPTTPVSYESPSR